ncbi:MFS transporter [Acetobacter conturbans]|uniref:MFS transporter n=1 Tax=Acetobacter conturbans TaxID=1737472 RepID=A0ABX0JUK6_9PROT|nr:glycoside-pentoside-hexuronide (GPH):cation symporter [Acetobacter conturbans]NHN87181.1 hypothetical protein [Acetobacter conturbans]
MTEADGKRPGGGKHSLPLKERMAFGLGDLVGNGMFGITGSYLIHFYTDVVGMAAGQLAMLMLVARIVHSFSDPVVGLIIDRRGLFSGRVMPYVHWFAVPLALSLCACFARPFSGATGELIWAWVSYLAMGIIFSFFIVPYGLLPNTMSERSDDRLSLSTYRMVGATLGTFLVGSLVPPAIAHFGYMAGIGLVAAAGAVVAMVPSWVCRERIALAPDRLPLKVTLRSLLQNRAWVVVTLALSLFYIDLTSFYGFAIYYAEHVLGRDAAFGGLLISVMGVTKATGVFVSSFVAPRLGWKPAITLGYACSMTGLILFWMAPNTAWLLIGLFGLVCFFDGIALPVFYTMLAEAIDIGAVLTGVRAAGIAYSMNSFAGKSAWALGGFLVAALLAWGGYDGHAAIQSEAARHAITFGFLGVPFCVGLLSIIVIQLYPPVSAATTMSNSAEALIIPED